MTVRRTLGAMAASLWIVTAAHSAELGLAPGNTVSVVQQAARLCPKSNCGEGSEITRIPVGTKLVVKERRVESTPFLDVVWYRVSFRGASGWVSEWTTDAAPAKPRLKRRRRTEPGT